MKEIAAGGIVYRKCDHRFEVQLIEDRYGHIAFPKGKMEKGETVQQTALREIAEETGMKGRLKQPIEVIHYQYEKPDHSVVEKEVHYFLVEAIEGHSRPQLEEIHAVQWYDLDSAWKKQQELGYENNASVLKKALACLKRMSLAAVIDHTLLKATAGYAQIEQLCQEAIEHGFYSVCVNSVWVETCHRLLEGSDVKISAVCGFPLGATATEVKVREAVYSIEKGASEIDMVLQVGLLCDGQNEKVYEDIKKVTDAVKQARADAIVKVILETGYLSDEQIMTGCMLAEKAGADFVKTSTGFGPRGASEQDIIIMNKSVSDHMKIKAAGGIRDYEAAQRFLELGVSRLGTSSGTALLKGYAVENNY